jgi:hypothetical protein
LTCEKFHLFSRVGWVDGSIVNPTSPFALLGLGDFLMAGECLVAFADLAKPGNVGLPKSLS